MKKLFAGSICIALSVVFFGTAYSLGDNPSPADIGTGSLNATLFEGAATSVPARAGTCPELAYTEIFRAKKLEYVDSLEFAESMQAVADGKSVYSPREIPPEWPAIAAGWRTILSGGNKGEASIYTDKRIGREDCGPALVYLASLEFRARPGHAEATPAFPRLVRAAASDLGSTAAAGNRMGPDYAKRAADIMTKFSEAERMGAQVCQPQELARARNELNRARSAASGVRAGVMEIDALFVNAENAADAILADRRFAFQQGFRCYPE
jgi:hypothetical protein